MCRRRAARWVILAAVIALVGIAALARWFTPSGLPPAPTTSVTQPRFDPAACPMRVPPNTRITCGYLVVPEDRSTPGGKWIRVAVAIARAPLGASSPPDPLVYLTGGPGLGVLHRTGWWPSLALWTGRDVIVVDQRGTGFSEPALDCPELDDTALDTLTRALTAEAAADLHAERALRCADRLTKAGIDLRHYTTADIAADLEDLRRALGVAEWNLLGVSHGARLGLIMLRDYPASVRAAVLDSVYMPPSVDYYADLRWAAAQALERVFATCAAAADCARAFPDLKGRFLALVERLNQSPLTFTLAAPVRDERAAPTKAKLSGASLVGLLYRLMYEDFNIKSVPGLIVALEAGDTRLLPTLLIDPIREPALYSEAMNHSIHCSEVAPFSVFTSTPAADPPVDPLYEGFYHFDVNPLAFQRFCPRWPTKPPTPNQNDPVRSDRPVLILAGAYDPASPVKHARVASATLSNSVYVEFPAQAHAVYTYDASGCAKAITRRFLDAPDTRPDVSCVDRLPAIHFLPPSAAR